MDQPLVHDLDHHHEGSVPDLGVAVQQGLQDGVEEGLGNVAAHTVQEGQHYYSRAAYNRGNYTLTKLPRESGVQMFTSQLLWNSQPYLECWSPNSNKSVLSASAATEREGCGYSTALLYMCQSINAHFESRPCAVWSQPPSGTEECS